MSTPGTFYVVRQARTRIVGSRVMTRTEADREARVWAAEIGPAVVLPATAALAHAIRYYDQDVLRPALYPVTGRTDPEQAHATDGDRGGPPPGPAGYAEWLDVSGLQLAGGRLMPKAAR